jgi:hypothetical protein
LGFSWGESATNLGRCNCFFYKNFYPYKELQISKLTADKKYFENILAPTQPFAAPGCLTGVIWRQRRKTFDRFSPI